jgi:hypothetical protein
MRVREGWARSRTTRSTLIWEIPVQTKHPGRCCPDGFVGPGTRKRLTRAILARGEGFFERGRISPEYAVFLSYSRKDEAKIKDLVEGIKSRGIPVFRDKESIPGGATWPDVLYRAIQKCQVLLCMLSPYSTESINVLIEVTLARHAYRPIVPVLVEAVELPDAMRSLLGSIQYVDLSRKSVSNEGLAEVLEAISAYGLSQYIYSK